MKRAHQKSRQSKKVKRASKKNMDLKIVKTAFVGKPKTSLANIKNQAKKTYSLVYQLINSSSSKWLKTLNQKKGKKTGVKPSNITSFLPGSFHHRHPKLIALLEKLLWPLTNPYARTGLILIAISSLVGLFLLMKDLPSPRRLTSPENFSVSSQIFDRNGQLLYEIFATENRIPIKLDDLPDYVIQATVAIEDQNFYHHFGFDIEGIIRALKANIQGNRLEGGSTITQQLVKNALLTPERSIKRKIKEGLLSMFTELLYSKDEILEMYLNYIAYGGTAVGIEAASQQYFDKHAKDLTIGEAALLAGLPQAPSYYSPFGSDPTRSKNRQAEVLRRMAEEGMITSVKAEDAKSEILQFALSRTDIRAPHFVFYVKDLLIQEYGEEKVFKGGLRVTTTLDIDLQEAAQASLSAEIDSLARLKVGNGAAIITKPNTGEILAMIGSSDYFDAQNDGQVNVVLAFRQPGSSIKPLMYATAFQKKILNPGSILLDIPTCFAVPGQKKYCPKNYNGGFSGPVTVRHALGNSLNIPAVKALSSIGVVDFINQATELGITTWNDPANYGLSLTLGGGEVRMIDMAQAFGVLANQGIKVPLTPFLKIEDYTGKTLMETDIEQIKSDLAELNNYETNSKGELERVLDQAPAYLISHILQDNNARLASFGAHSELVIPNQVVSVKTGTTNDLKDNWTIGYTPEFLVATWVGNNDNKPMSYVASGVTGASPIFNHIMRYVLQGKEPLWQEKPQDVSQLAVCANGMPVGFDSEHPNCSATYNELFWKESKPSRSSLRKENTWIKPETGLPPAFGEQAEGLVLEEKTIYQDPVTDSYCADCNRPVDEEGKVVYEEHLVDYAAQTILQGN